MNPLQPQDAFGTTHVAALLLLGVDAMAQDVDAMATEGSPNAVTEPDDFHFALVGLCALRSQIRRFADSTPRATSRTGFTWLQDDEGVLR